MDNLELARCMFYTQGTRILYSYMNYVLKDSCLI